VAAFIQKHAGGIADTLLSRNRAVQLRSHRSRWQTTGQIGLACRSFRVENDGDV
jgi:hypothetical protein